MFATTTGKAESEIEACPNIDTALPLKSKLKTPKPIPVPKATIKHKVAIAIIAPLPKGLLFFLGLLVLTMNFSINS